MTELEQRLLSFIKTLHGIKRFWVGYSGGVDSHVLLHALSRICDKLNPLELHAVHIDHQLSPMSSQWSEHCREVCRNLHIPYHCIVVDAKAGVGESQEAKAREVRYAAFTSLVKTSDCLLTAHHQDDQAETLLLQLLRGSGPRGLAAMPSDAVFGEGRLARPLLDFTRGKIEQYAHSHQLCWINDISNADPSFDRNFLRLQVIPLLKQRWPAMAKTISRSAQLCADTLAILDDVADKDLKTVVDGNAAKLSIARLRSLNIERQHNVVRAWFKSLGLPYPSQKILLHLWQQVINASPDSVPHIAWPGAEVRRYRDHLYAMSPLGIFDHSPRLTWDIKNPLSIAGAASLEMRPAVARGLKKSCVEQCAVSVGFRHGGERCKLPKRGGLHTLKNLFQEMGVVPWMRERIPLIFIGDQLAAVGDLWVCEGFIAAEQEDGLEIACDYERSIK